MDTQTVETPTPPDIPLSIADHAAKFGPAGPKDGAATTPQTPTPAAPEAPPVAAAPPEEPKERERHRAASQQATAKDAPRIAELTRRRHEAEERANRLEAELNALKAKQTPATPPVNGTKESDTSGFSEPIPKLEDFSGESDPYESYLLAKAEWRANKRAFEAKQADEARQRVERETAAAREADEADQQRVTSYQGRLSEFVKTHPDFNEKLQAAKARGNQIPGALMVALQEDDNGPEILYHLLTHPQEFDRVLIEGYALPQTFESVAILRRRLQTYTTQAASTGSAAGASPVVLAPRPPNPVRTGPMPAPDPSPRAGSVSAHLKAYGQGLKKR